MKGREDLSPAKRGRLGGLAMFARHGNLHMRIIGRAGYESTLERHFAGDARAHYEHLLRLRHAPQVLCPRNRCTVRKAA